MTEGLKSFWISIGAGAVLSVAAAPFAYTFWKTEIGERALVRAEIAELNSKLAKSNDALTQLQKTASVESIAKQLAQLNGRIKSASDQIAGLQKATALDGVVKQIAALDSKIGGAEAAIGRANGALAELEKSASLDAVTQQLGQLAAEVKQANGVPQQIEKLAAEIKSANEALADIQKASMTTGSTGAAKAPALQNSIGDLAKRIEDEKTARARLSQDIAHLQDALKKEGAPKAKPAPGAERNDVVVFYVQSPEAMAKAQAASPIPPMTVRFEKIGGLNDSGQADMIAQKLKAITKGRSGCTVTVAGYADTLGSDKVNLAISKMRAHAIAGKLKAAFAGDQVQITEAAWGERRLQEWTPNEVAREANRRVDVSVDCKESAR
jgi:predicted  nucleic acid-binding Zn-ribbon protein